MTQIDIAALVADLTGPIPVIEGLSGPYPDETAIRDTADQAVAALIAQDAELKRLRLSVSAQEDRIDGLTILLAEALPWVEAQLDDPAYKPGTVRAVANRIRAALGEKP